MMGRMRPQTILVVDDQKEIADYVRQFLEKAGFEVIIARDGKNGLSIAKKVRPDLVVLDITMPYIDGLEVCTRLRADPRRQRLPILLLSARAAATDRVLGLETGADDYLVKPFDPAELVARVKALLRRAELPETAAATICAGDLCIDLHAHKVTHGSVAITLTAAQFRILELLALNAGRVLTRDEIIEATLCDGADVTERTVDAHIASIRKALGCASIFIETARNFGYIFQKNPTS
jgi:two-component system phosphate regulon response regulator PhoB